MPDAKSWRTPRLAAALAVAWSAAAAAQAPPFSLERVVGGLARPLGLVAPGDGSGRLFVVLQGGRILVLAADGSLRPEPFLDLSDRVSCCGERGLLGLAFHPDFESNGLFFVNYTDPQGDTVVSRFAVSADPDRADPTSERGVLTYAQPFANHNGGHLAFGPDGYLYIASGDGGGAGDPQNNGQSLDTLLGKLLRIDVDGSPYAIPPDNPFIGDPEARPEIWAYGLRNPWRFSFDRATGDLFVGDVGQSSREEIDFQPVASGGGENYGWRRMEGSLCFDPPSNCDDDSLVPPILEYGHDAGCSVTGGFRYRGGSVPQLAGVYLFADFCAGTLWGATEEGGVWSATVLAETGLAVSSFGEDEAGELYLTHLDAEDGAVYRLAADALFADGFESGDASRWHRRRGQVAVVEPGLGGTGHALAATATGTSAPAFVMTRRARGSARLVVQFVLSANAVDLGAATVRVVEIRGGGTVLAAVELEPAGQRYGARLLAHDGGGLVFLGDTRVRRRRTVRLTLEWVAAS
ncbi:MAG: PQQ-dependent sugar dehydrogenase, partial [Thermoanaerobaculia bacterium]